MVPVRCDDIYFKIVDKRLAVDGLLFDPLTDGENGSVDPCFRSAFYFRDLVMLSRKRADQLRLRRNCFA